jgi:16S rRNA (adenine1518-N6/adenine1519-N6)-dimethyltransferase
MRARKRFGQHFLHDESVIARIVAAVDPQPADVLIEIGPGHGALTRALLERCTRLRAIEIDRDLARELRTLFAASGAVEIIEADVLTVDFRALRGSGPRLRLVGNLPYNISTPLIFHLLGAHDAFSDAHFMLQKEVVARMAARPGSKTYGRLTVMLAPYCRVEPLFDVPPSAFRPPPKVTSTVARLIPHTTPPFKVKDPALFAHVVAAAFSQRRKTLRNALRAVAEPALMSEVGIDPGDRPERIAPEQYAALSNTLAQR